MKHIWLLTLLAALPSCASAQTVSMTSRVVGLRPMATAQEAYVAVAPAKVGLGVAVLSNFGCTANPSNPKVFQSRNAVTLSVESVEPPSELTFAALCTRELRFLLKGLAPGPKVIYYVQDGRVIGHAGAP